MHGSTGTIGSALRSRSPTSDPPGHRRGSPAVDGRMSTWLLLGGLIVVVIIVGTALELWENRRIDREAH